MTKPTLHPSIFLSSYPFSKIFFGSLFLLFLLPSQEIIAQVDKTQLYQNPVIRKIQDTHAARDYESAEALADDAMKKFYSEKNEKDYAEAIFMKAKVAMHRYRIDESIEWYDSCATYSKNHQLNYHYASALSAQADILNYQNKSDLALQKAKEAILIKELPYDIYSGCYSDLATSFDAKGMTDSSDYYSIAGYHLDTTHQIYSMLGASNIRMGNIESRKGNNEKAIAYYLKSLDYVPKGKEARKNRAYLNLCNSYFQIRNLDKAEEYAQKLKTNAEAFKLKTARAQGIFKLGNISEERGNYSQAIGYYEEALARFKNSKNKKWRIDTYLGLAKCYLELDQLREAKDIIKNIRIEVEPSDNDKLKVKYYIVESLFNLKNNDFTATLNMLKKAEQAAIFQKNLYRQRDIHKIYSEYYKKVNQPNLAFASLENYHMINDSLSFIQQSYNVFELEAKFQKVEQDLTIQKLDADKALMNQKLNRRNIAIGIGSLFLVLFSVLSYLIYNLYKKNKEKTIEVSNKNQLLSKALNDKEFLIKEIHHRVKNNLQIVSSLLSLQARNVQDEVALDALKEGQSRVRSMALIHQNLYQDDDLIGVDAKAYIEKLSEGLFHSYNINNDKIKLHADIEDIKLDVDTIIPLGLIINELITNALKYAFKNRDLGNIHLELKKENNQLVFSLLDDGIGLPASFSFEKSKSLGYRLVKAFSQKLEAVLQIDGSNGTKVTLIIPNK